MLESIRYSKSMSINSAYNLHSPDLYTKGVDDLYHITILMKWSDIAQFKYYFHLHSCTGSHRHHTAEISS